MNKSKVNRKPGKHDLCQTPPYALRPLLPYLNDCLGCGAVVWESAASVLITVRTAAIPSCFQRP